MRERALAYDDPWKQFKKTMLEQVDYFKPYCEDPYFLEELHYHLKEEFIDKGTEIVGPTQPASSIVFIILGIVDLKVSSTENEEKILETLEQGDVLT